ncbi:MAG: YeeE/YedE family protein [Pseudomonadota bacterium]
MRKTPLILVAALGGFTLWQAAQEGATHVQALAIGLLAGLALYHARFGFSAGWRRWVREGRGREVRAQILLIGLISAVSFPLIGYGEARGVVMPMGIASAFGAFLFGIGMQAGGGCASGTLYTAGGGSTRMVLVLIAFMAGSVWATYHWPFWAFLPRSGGVSVITALGWPAALAAMLGVLGALWVFSVWRERRRCGGLEATGLSDPAKASLAQRLFCGPWSIWAGAGALAVVGVLWFALLGGPWGVTYGFAVWGAQAADAMGLEPGALAYWQGWRQGDLQGGLLSSRTNASNVGILLGALAAAGLAGRFAPIWHLSLRDVATAIAGGLMMGYGARLAYGCNIGAFLGGLTSGSLHGLWWLGWGFAGSLLGIRLRGLLAMDPPRQAKGAF